MSDRAQLLESLMIAAAGSIRAFSKISGVPQSTIMSILRKPESATIQNAIRICRALGVGLDIFDAGSTDVVSTGDELQLLRSFRLTDNKTREIILSVAKTASAYEDVPLTIAAHADNLPDDKKAKAIERAAKKAMSKYWGADDDGDGED